MSKKTSELQKKVMSRFFRGKEIFKPLNTGYITDDVGCIREYGSNIFFYKKNGTTLMIDAGYDYDELRKKMRWLGIKPEDIHNILLTHQDADNVGAVAKDSAHLLYGARLYLGEAEVDYVKGRAHRKIFDGLYPLPRLESDNPIRLLRDGQVFYLGDIKIECIFVPGHTRGHVVYLLDDQYLFTGDAIWLGPDGGYSFLNVLAEDKKLAVMGLKKLKNILVERNLRPMIITGHTGWTDDFDFAFAHIDQCCNVWAKPKIHDPKAPYDAYEEQGDTMEKARTIKLRKQKNFCE